MSNENTRIYVVTQSTGEGNGAADSQHLVRAGSQAQAIRHVVSDQFSAEVASQDDLVTLLGKGVKVREATA
jgi:hypothetical protein